MRNTRRRERASRSEAALEDPESGPSGRRWWCLSRDKLMTVTSSPAESTHLGPRTPSENRPPRRSRHNRRLAGSGIAAPSRNGRVRTGASRGNGCDCEAARLASRSRGAPWSRPPQPPSHPDDWLAISRQIHDVLARNVVDGVVVTHGTNNLEEIAYFCPSRFRRRSPS